MLTSPIFFKEEEWIPVDQFMSKTGIIQGKGFDTETENGNEMHIIEGAQLVEKKLCQYWMLPTLNHIMSKTLTIFQTVSC